MKKQLSQIFTSATLLTSLALAGCASTDVATANTAGNTINTATNIGMNVLKVAIDNKCRHELEQQNAWQIARIAMTPAQAEQVQNKVCGCVSEQAPQQISIVDMTNATLDPQYRSQLVARVVAKSLQSCYASLVK